MKSCLELQEKIIEMKIIVANKIGKKWEDLMPKYKLILFCKILLGTSKR